MAQSVVRGWVDNRAKGKVTGEIFLLGREDPVRLDLEGNANPDVAGCRLDFTNPSPSPGDHTNLAAEQRGTPGDMTCSRKCRVLDVPLEDTRRLREEGREIPSHWANTLYLEWFSERNGRVVIETVDFEVRMSDRAWSMTTDDSGGQAEGVRDAMLGWMDRLVEAQEAAAPPYDPADDEPMDEYAWEKFMKESDRKSERYGELLEKYHDHPDRDRIVAHEMGWTRLEEALDARERGLLPSEPPGDEEILPDPEPDPLTEGRDWVRDEHGEPVHPLVFQTHNAAHGMWEECNRRGLLGEDGSEDVREMLFQAHCVCAKLAGALNGLAYQEDPDAGFIVAYLKRAMPYLNDALAAEQKVRAASLLPPERLDTFRNELFAVRDSILALMERFRAGS
jgi:hypothetical protein